MEKTRFTAALLFACLAYTSVQADIPAISGNEGMPGLIAEIEALQAELDAAESELEETEADLAATEDELGDIEDELAETEEELAQTEEELAAEKRRFRIPRTGQDECFDAFSKDPDDPHFTVHCTDTGQDGDARSGLVPPTNRFTDNGDGTVTDNFTRLVWLQSANCIAATEPDWDTALNLAAALPGTTFPLCGLGEGSVPGDWRVPNVNELMSLVSYGTNATNGTGLPDGHPFIDFEGYYWTSTTFGLQSDQPVSQIIYPCRRQGYPDNRLRFNDAYVVNINTGEVVRLPKESGPNITKRHKTSDGGSCTGLGFTSGSPDASPHAFPAPRFIAVRDAAEE